MTVLIKKAYRTLCNKNFFIILTECFLKLKINTVDLTITDSVITDLQYKTQNMVWKGSLIG